MPFAWKVRQPEELPMVSASPANAKARTFTTGEYARSYADGGGDSRLGVDRRADGGVERGKASDADARELFHRRETGCHLGEAVVPDRAHTGRECRSLDLLARALPGGERRKLLGHFEKLEDADSTPVARLAAPRTAELPVEGHPVHRGGHVGRDARCDQLFHRRGVHLATVGAELASKALREHSADGRARKERLDSHLVETRDRSWRVVRVERREHEVTGEGGLDRDLGRLAVANLTHHDHVRVGTEDRPK